MEPVNKRNIRGNADTPSAQRVSILNGLAHTNTWLKDDIYHMQIREGDIARTIERLMNRIPHFQLADNPGSNEPRTGEINYPFLFSFIDGLGYDAWIGCEYRPAGRTEDGLGWATPYLG